MRAHLYKLDEHGQPVPVADIIEWGTWFEKADRRLALTECGPGVEVSTVFLGSDHRFVGDGPPVLWETLVRGGPLDGKDARYASVAAAVAGHAAMVERVRRALDMPLPEDE
jgi:hypothetical protein